MPQTILHNPLATAATTKVVNYIDDRWVHNQTVKRDAITQLIEQETHLTELIEALAWLEEMASYAVRHLDPDWNARNGADVQDAIEKARQALQNTL